MKQSYTIMPYVQSLKPTARMLRTHMTPAEKRLWQAIRKRKIEKSLFLRQKPVLSYIADFYCAELLLIIEIDGSSHYHKKELDAARTMELQTEGCTVIRYTNDQVFSELPRVLAHLSRIIHHLRTTRQQASLPMSQAAVTFEKDRG